MVHLAGGCRFESGQRRPTVAQMVERPRFLEGSARLAGERSRKPWQAVSWGFDSSTFRQGGVTERQGARLLTGGPV